MMKRLRWLVIGAALGVAAYVWASRRARTAVPELRAAGDGARELGARLREAWGEGVRAMRERERELRGDLP